MHRGEVQEGRAGRAAPADNRFIELVSEHLWQGGEGRRGD